MTRLAIKGTLRLLVVTLLCVLLAGLGYLAIIMWIVFDPPHALD
jgi:hypothetical protein